MDQIIKLDTRKREGAICKPRISPLRRGERNNVTLTVSVRRDRRPYDLAGMTAHLVWQAADDKLVGSVPMEVSDTASGTVRCTLPDACYSAVGTARAYIELRRGAELVDTTDEMLIEVLDCIDADAEQAEEYKPLIAEVMEATDAAKSAAERAESGEDERAAAERARVSAEESREQAEQARKQAESTRASSETLRALSETSRAEAESLRKQAESLRGESETKREEAFAESVENANAANAAATKAVADAQAAIAEVKATEAKLYPAAENILVGSETGTVAHVEDAFSGAALRKIVVEGAAKQDGIPSPESPKPITVIEHPTVRIVGRNILDFTFPAYQSVYSSGIAVIPYYAIGEKNQTLPLTTQASSAGFGFVLKLAPGTYTIKALNAPNKAAVNVAGYRTFDDIQDKNKNLWYVVEQSLSRTAAFDVVGEQQYVVICFAAEWGDGTNKITYPADFKAVVEYGGTATDYEPYTEQPITFTLPAEHPYLAKLPDGTADEIVVDEEGNVELVARVMKVLPKDAGTLNFGAGTDTGAPYASFRISGLASRTGILCNGYQTNNWTNKSGYIYSPGGIDIVIRDDRFTSKEKAIELLNGVVVYIAVEPTRYSLGKIEMPKAQDSIVNAWTDAEVTPSTGIGYVLGVNIVVANIESAIASITEG